MPLQIHVGAAKAGVDAISATVALEYGPRGITSNIITPGPSKQLFSSLLK
jgi:peroxisomal 2,4-dienoyl-CoA reductase